jgi:hypothetical protein
MSSSLICYSTAKDAANEICFPQNCDVISLRMDVERPAAASRRAASFVTSKVKHPSLEVAFVDRRALPPRAD